MTKVAKKSDAKVNTVKTATASTMSATTTAIASATLSSPVAKKSATSRRSTTANKSTNPHVTRNDIINLTRTTPRIGVTDLQKDTRGWRRKLKASGLIEITDRNSTAGYLVSVETIQRLAQDFEEQERLIEEQAVQAMFNARSDVADWKSGITLAEGAKEIYKNRFSSVNQSSE